MPAITIRTVSCSACTTSFPVDPAKVPPGGVRARCSVCGAIFRVEGADSVAPDGPPAPPEATADRVGVASFPEAGPDPDTGPEPWSGVPDDPTDPHGEAVVVEEPGEGAAPEWDEHAPPDAGEPPADSAVVDDPSLGWFPEAPADDGESAAESADPTAPWELQDETPAEPTAPWAPQDEAQPEPTAPWEPQDEAQPEPAAPWEPQDEAQPGPSEPWEPAAEAPPEPSVPWDPLEEPGAEVPAEPEAGVEDEIFAVDDLPEPVDDAPEYDAPAHDAPPAEDGGDEDPFAGTAVEDYVPPVPSTPPEEVAPLPQGFQFGRRDPHEKARRLARVLVSDIITYNPERYLRALENDSLREDFEEEIGKSWTEYVEQVGPEVANETDYWKAALNDLLARGRDVF
jgi:predicted Zn finger-like uncharacterized protein